MDPLQVVTIERKDGSTFSSVNEGPHQYAFDGDGPFVVPKWMFEKWLSNDFDIIEGEE